MLLIVSSSVNMIQAFHHVWISQNQTNIKLQNQAPSQIPKNDNPKVNKYTRKDFCKNCSGTVGLDPTAFKDIFQRFWQQSDLWRMAVLTKIYVSKHLQWLFLKFISCIHNVSVTFSRKKLLILLGIFLRSGTTSRCCFRTIS